MLNELLGFLEDNIDLDHIRATEELHKKTLNFEKVSRIPIKISAPVNYNKSPFAIECIHKDPLKMLYNELLASVNTITLKDDSLPMVRANYGVGIMPSLFGLKSTIVNGNMPWVSHVDRDGIEKILKSGMPSLDTGYGAEITKTHKIYKEVFSQYPKIKEGIRVYHSDLQGPFDVAHIIWGSDIYMDMYDVPQLVHDLLELITKTYIQFIKKIYTEINDNIGGYIYHWGALYKGNVLLRNDSAVNISADMFDRFVKPYDEMIYEALGGGSMHFCGRADHWLNNMLGTEGLMGLNHGYMPNLEFGNTYLDKVFDGFKTRKIPLIQYVMTQEEHAAFDKDKYSTGITLSVLFDSFDEAKNFINPL